MVKKYVGLDRLVDDLISELGQLEAAYIVGDYARGVDSGLIDLVLVGQVNQDVLQRLIDKTSNAIARKIRPLVIKRDELNGLWDQLDIEHALPIWLNSEQVSANNSMP